MPPAQTPTQTWIRRGDTNYLRLAAYRERTQTYYVTLYDSAGDVFDITCATEIRLKVDKEGLDPFIDLYTGASSDNGSYVTLTNDMKLYLHQNDLTFAAGIYNLQLAAIDEDGQWVLIAQGSFTLFDTASEGDTFLPYVPPETNVATKAELPRVYVAASYQLPEGGTTYSVSASTSTADLQTILDGLNDDDVVILDKDGEWEGLVFRKTAGSGWKYIISSAMLNLPGFGARVTPTYASSMPTIKTKLDGGNLYPAINTEVGASYYHFAGIRLEQQTHLDKQKTRMMMLGRVPIGDANGTLHPTALGISSYEEVGHHIVIDRCIFEGDDQNSYRGLYLDANDSVVIGCYFHKLVVDPRLTSGYADECKAIEITHIAGRLLIHNNYLAASSINLMIGNDEAGPFGTPPLQDIVVRENYFYKDPQWAGMLALYPGTASLKNHIECKGGNRLLWERNTFENQFFGNQGRSVVVKVSTGHETDNVTIRNNTARNVTGAISITNATAAQRIGAVTVENNVFTGIGEQAGSTLVEDTIILTSSGLPTEDVWFSGNVFQRNVPTEESHIGILDAQTGITRFTYINNTSPAGQYGIKASGTASGVASLNVLASEWEFTENTITNSEGLNYPPGNTLS